MSKESNRKRKQRRKKRAPARRQRGQATRQPRSLGKTVSRWLLSSWSGVVFVSVFVSIVGFAFLVYPRVSIEPGAVIERLNPFYTPFVLANEGQLSIRDVKFSCGLGSVFLKGNKEPTFSQFGVSIAGAEVSLLKPGKSTSIPFDRVFSKNMPIEKADITVVVSYRSSWLPFVFSDTQDFKTAMNHRGELVWVPNDGRAN